MHQPKLKTIDLRKTYGRVVALAGASLDLEEGEFLTLLGPSGSGKTTMLMTIAGLVQPDSGEVWIDGRLATYAPPHKRDIGMVFQNYALFPHLTVSENIAFPLRMRGMTEADIRREVTRALDLVQLPEVGGRLPARALGRTAAAHRARPLHRLPPFDRAHGRAARRPRQEAPRPNEAGDQAALHRARHHRPLRHARPGGGDDHVGPRLSHEQLAGSSRSALPPISISDRAAYSRPTSSASRTCSTPRSRASTATR